MTLSPIESEPRIGYVFSMVMNAPISRYMHIVRYLAKRIYARLPNDVPVDAEDLVTAGRSGLMAAADNFDLDRGVRFEIFCIQPIRRAIFDKLRRTYPALPQVRSSTRKVEPDNMVIREIDVVPDNCQVDPSDVMQRTEIKKFFKEGLSTTEKLILTLYYFEELPMEDIGRLLDLPESRAWQLHTSMLARLKSNLECDEEE